MKKELVLKTKKLIKEYRETGDIALRNTIFKENVGLVSWAIKRTNLLEWSLRDAKVKGVTPPEYCDIFQEAANLLLECIEKVDSEKGLLSTFYVRCMKRNLKKTLGGYDLIHVPAMVRYSVKVLLSRYKDRLPTDEEIQIFLENSEIGLSSVRAHMNRIISGPILSLDDMDMSLLSHQEFYRKDSLEETIVHARINEQMLNKVKNLLSQHPISGRDLEIFWLHWESEEKRDDVSNQELGNLFGITGERIRQIIERIMRVLRRSSSLRELLDDEFLESVSKKALIPALSIPSLPDIEPWQVLLMDLHFFEHLPKVFPLLHWWLEQGEMLASYEYILSLWNDPKLKNTKWEDRLRAVSRQLSVFFEREVSVAEAKDYIAQLSVLSRYSQLSQKQRENQRLKYVSAGKDLRFQLVLASISLNQGTLPTYTPEFLKKKQKVLVKT